MVFSLSPFALSQVLAAVAIICDLLSFQFKNRRQIIAFLMISCSLIAAHFLLLNHWTAASMAGLAALRFFVSYHTTSKTVMALFLLAALALAALTFEGVLSVLSCLGGLFGTIGSFCTEDRRLRQMLFLATSCWLLHNILARTPTAACMEALFLASNLLGYYRFYLRRAGRAESLQKGGQQR